MTTDKTEAAKLLLGIASAMQEASTSTLRIFLHVMREAERVRIGVPTGNGAEKLMPCDAAILSINERLDDLDHRIDDVAQGIVDLEHRIDDAEDVDTSNRLPRTDYERKQEDIIGILSGPHR